MSTQFLNNDELLKTSQHYILSTLLKYFVKAKLGLMTMNDSADNIKLLTGHLPEIRKLFLVCMVYQLSSIFRESPQCQREHHICDEAYHV